MRYLFALFSLAIVTGFFALYHASQQEQLYRVACEARSGVTFQSKGSLRLYCIKTTALIDLADE